MYIRRLLRTQQLCEIENHRPIPNKFAGPLTTGNGSVQFAQRARHFLERGRSLCRKVPTNALAYRRLLVESDLQSNLSKLVELTEPDIAHGYLAWLAFDFEADEAGLAIDGVRVVVDEYGH